MRSTSTCLTLACLLHLAAARAQTSPAGSAGRSDSIDILHTRIELDLTNTGNGMLRGDATISFTPLVNGIATLPLDLLLPADSVMMDGSPLAFTQPGEVLAVELPGTYGPGDTLAVKVSYHGDPPTDPSGFGGFYTLNNYQYDLGVAFDAIPHSYGRAWFPCFDNFRERCPFDFVVHTNGGRSVFANGALQGITELGNGERITHWRIDEPIPAYLASVAAGQYAAITDTFPSTGGAQVPVILAALPGDTAQMRASFAHLRDAFNTFEQWFGPYRWNRVGYVLTSAGAMEHATNICYPDFAADGSLDNEDLIAHELSHHWFGDLITCARPEEMYINEGFADFCANLHMEQLYGPEAYQARVRSNHFQVVAQAHLRDAGWYALADVPQNVTYGETSYKKGSDIARTLRAVMGDSLFSAGFKHVFAANAYRPMDSAALRDSLTAATGMDLTGFFNNWVFQPGGAAFTVDSFSVAADGGAYAVDVHVRQKNRGGAAPYTNVPVSVTCVGPNAEIHRQLANLGGSAQSFTVPCPFAPAAVRLNDDERLALATTVDTATITATGQRNLANADLFLATTALAGPTRLRVEQFWVPADEDPSGLYFTSPDRWWRVEGTIAPGTDIKLRFTLDGRSGLYTAYDQGLVQGPGGMPFTEDSLVVLHRTDASQPWAPMPANILSLGSHTDKFARVEMPGLVPGDYTLALRMHTTPVKELPPLAAGWRYYPDPASDRVTVVPPDDRPLDGAKLIVQDLSGRTLLRQAVHSSPVQLDIARLRSQMVVLSVRYPGGGQAQIGRLHIIH